MKLIFSDEEFNGVLITFCGIDGCGKTTQIEALKNKLRNENYDVFKTFQPTKEMRENFLFRSFVDGHQEEYQCFEYRSLNLLTVSDRLQHSRHVILPELMNGKVVISDRYFYSALVNLRARGYTEDKWIYEIARYIPKPDLAIFFDVNFEVALQRVRNREEERNRYIDIKFHKKLWEEFKYVSNNTECVVLNTECDIDELADNIYLMAQKIIKEKQPIKK